MSKSKNLNLVHPILDLEKGTLKINRKNIENNDNALDDDDEYYEYGYCDEGDGRRSSSSRVSLSAELVEAIMHDGQIRLTSKKAHETAMWCGMFSFLILGVGMMGIGLFMIFSRNI